LKPSFCAKEQHLERMRHSLLTPGFLLLASFNPVTVAQSDKSNGAGNEIPVNGKIDRPAAGNFKSTEANRCCNMICDQQGTPVDQDHKKIFNRPCGH
jgi:hypothetical protein